MRIKTLRIAAGAAILCLIFLAWIAAGANRRVVRTMKWHYAASSARWPSSKHIVLTFADHPHHFIGVYSRDLGAYLESLPGREVRVVFDVSPVFGGMHGKDWINPAKLLELAAGRLRGNLWHRTVQIGELTHWQSDFSYGGREANSQGSPWD